MVANDRQNDLDTHLPHIECDYNKSVSAGTGPTPHEVHISCFFHVSLAIFQRLNKSGRQSLGHDKLAHCDLAIDCQRRSYSCVRERQAVTFSRVERCNSQPSKALYKAPQIVSGGWVEFAIQLRLSAKVPARNSKSSLPKPSSPSTGRLLQGPGHWSHVCGRNTCWSSNTLQAPLSRPFHRSPWR